MAIIRDPGKFEGEPTYVRGFWDLRSGDEQIYDGDQLHEVFILTEEDRSEWPDLDPDAAALVLWETTDGFVLHREMTEPELDQFRRACDTDERHEA